MLDTHYDLTLNETPQLIATGQTESVRYIQLFTDAAQTGTEDQPLADIIEPIACPFGPYGNHDLKVTYIIIEQEVFAMNCERI